MAMRYSKSAFVFSFLALFISILVYGFAMYYLNLNSFSEVSNIDSHRISSINSQIDYFDSIFLDSALKISSNLALIDIINYSNNSVNYIKLNKNYTKLNSLFYELMTNSSLDSIHINNYDNFSIYNLTDIFKNDFESKSRVNFTFKLINLNIYESQPYYVDFVFLISYNVSMIDNLSSWNITEYKKISLPVYDFVNPDFLLNANKSIPIKSYDMYSSNLNWNLTNFNNTLNNFLSIVFLNKNYEYTLGNSFLSNLLNYSIHSYDKVLAFYSFDYDLEHNYLYDSANNLNTASKFYDNSYLLLDFNSNQFSDKSVYNHFLNNKITNSLQKTGVDLNGSIFDGVDDYINISNSNFNLNFTNELSISFWLNPSSFPLGTNKSTIFVYGNNSNNLVEIDLLSSGKIQFIIGNHSNGKYHKFISSSNISLDKFSFIVVSFDGNTGIGKIYINNKLNNFNDDFSLQTSKKIDNFNFSISNITLGYNFYSSNISFYNGSLDEFGVFSKVLSNHEISNLYGSIRVKRIDYQSSFHGSAIHFDGIDDYVLIKNNLLATDFNSNFSIGVWFKSYNNSGNHTIYSKYYPLVLKIENDTLISGFYDSNFLFNNLSFFNLTENKNYYVVSTWNKSSKNYSLYVNSKLVNSSIFSNGPSIVNNDFFYLGVDKNSTEFKRFFFNGLIDEFKVYNKTLSFDDIVNNYYDYNSFSKGCCNYLTLVNPNYLGLNDSNHVDNVSYSSKVFFDYYNRGRVFENISLWSLSNITSSSYNTNYFNFLVDSCMIQAYDLPYNNINLSFRNQGNYSGKCENLIKLGIY